MLSDSGGGLHLEIAFPITITLVLHNPDLTRELTTINGESWSKHHGIVIRESMPLDLVEIIPFTPD